jgi:hypothetical protein
MASGVDLSLKVIARSKNKAATKLLETAFRSTDVAVRKLAGEIFIERRSGQGLEVIIRAFDPSDTFFVELVNDNRAKLIPGLRGAIVDKDIALARQAFRLAYTQNFFEVLPTLAAFCLGPGGREMSGLSLNTDLLKFIDKFTDALEKNDPAEHQLLYNIVLPEFPKILVQKIRDYRFSRHELTLTVYLRLYPFFLGVGNDKELHLQLQLPNSPVYISTYRQLLKESKPYLFQLVTRCLDRLNPPQIVPQIISERFDVPFLEALFMSIRKPLSLELKSNLASLPPVPWVNQIDSVLHELNVEAQCGLILFLQSISLTDQELQTSLLKIFEFGSESGRVAALSALSAFSGAEIIRLVWDAAEDADPAVQIEALSQIQIRGIPGAVARILQFVESPHEEVRDVIQRLLPNFRFSRLLQTFDQLDDDQRRQMFNIVRHLDKKAPKEISKMLSTGEPLQKAKALLCIDYCLDIVPLVEDALCELLAHAEMPTLRSKAAEQLVAGRGETSRTLLVQAFHRDASSEVRDAAKKSLEQRPVYWNQSDEN